MHLRYYFAVRVSNSFGTVTSASATLTVHLRPRLTAVARLENGDCRFRLIGQPDISYTIQASSNLTTWTSLTNLADHTGLIDFTDSEVPNFPHRFYRVLER